MRRSGNVSAPLSEAMLIMKPNYNDILNRIPEPPLWWDDWGVPRYAPFHPMHASDTSSKEVALILVICQCCRHEFPVLVTEHMQRGWDSILRFGDPKPRDLSDAILDGSIDYGDPPNACCVHGASMDSIPQRVLEYWYNLGKGPWVEPDYGWVRGNGLEIRIEVD
jgi:hypothetical protein